MSKKSFDKRLAFVAAVLNQKINDNANLANEWYISHGGAKMENEEALRRFKEWIA